MPKVQACWGLDVSKSSVKGIRLEKSKDGIEVAACDIVEYPIPPEGEEVDVNDRIREGLAMFTAKHKLRREHVAVSLPGYATFNRIIKLPLVDPSRLPEMVRYEAQQQIPFPIEEVIWDYQTIEKEYQIGEEMEIGLFAIKRELVGSFLGVLAAAAISPDIVQFGPLAIFNFMKFDHSMEKANLILDVGADNSDLVVADGPNFWIRNLPIAGNDISKAIQKKFQIPFAEAENLKLAAGESKKAEKVMSVIKPILRDLVGEIHRSIGYYKSISRQTVFDRMILLGGGAKLAGLSKFFTDSLQLQTARLSTLNNVSISPKVDSELFQRNLSSFTVALGLALQGLGESVNRINLLPPEVIHAREIARKRPFVAAAAVFLFVTVLAAYGSLSSTIGNLSGLLTEMDDIKTRVDGFHRDAENKAQLGDRIERISILEELGMYRDLPLMLPGRVSAFLEKNADDDVPNDQKLWLTMMELEAKKVEVTNGMADLLRKLWPELVGADLPKEWPIFRLKAMVHIIHKVDEPASMQFVRANLIEQLDALLADLGLKPISPIALRIDPRLYRRPWPAGKEPPEEDEGGGEKTFQKFTLEVELVVPPPGLRTELWQRVSAIRPEGAPKAVEKAPSPEPAPAEPTHPTGEGAPAEQPTPE